MSVDIKKLVAKVHSGKFSRKELENLRKNAISKGGAEDVVTACDQMLASLPKPRGGGTRKTSSSIAEKRNGYTIMSTAYDSDGNLLKPGLVKVAEELATNNLVEDISILKTQIKLYYKGRHFTSGCKAHETIFWVSCLDETKITDQTIECWRKLGAIGKGKYFSTYYVAVAVDELHKLHAVFDCVVFT